MILSSICQVIFGSPLFTTTYSVLQRFPKPKVAGSNPAGRSKKLFLGVLRNFGTRHNMPTTVPTEGVPAMKSAPGCGPESPRSGKSRPPGSVDRDENTQR